MLFSAELLIPANTSREAPSRLFIPVTNGIIKQVWVRWRFGAGGLCGCRVLYAEFQLFPFSMGEWLRSHRETITWEEYFILDTAPVELALEAYNLDDTFAHRAFVGMNIIRPTLTDTAMALSKELIG